jgi:Effector Associated Constant Component 1
MTREMTHASGDGSITIGAGDPDDLDATYSELRGVPGIVVRPVQGPLEPGDQGSMIDLLTVACSGGAVTVLLQIIRDLVGSRGPGFTLKVRRGKDRLEVTAENVEDVLPLIKEMLDGPDS